MMMVVSSYDNIRVCVINQYGLSYVVQCMCTNDRCFGSTVLHASLRTSRIDMTPLLPAPSERYGPVTVITAGVTPDQRSPSLSQGITAIRPTPIHTVCWEVLTTCPEYLYTTRTATDLRAMAPTSRSSNHY